MECKYCKSEVPDGSAFCNHCGKKLARAKKSDSEKKKYEYVRKSFVFEGKQYFVSGKNEREASRRLAEKELAVRQGNAGLSDHLLVSAWAETWLRDYIRPKVRKPGEKKMRGTMTEKSYRNTYERPVNSYIVPAIGKMKMRDVRDVHLKRILNAESNKSFSHVSKLRIVIKAMFSQAYVSRLIPFDPSVSLELPAVEKGSRRSLTDAEREALEAVAKTHRNGFWIRFLIGTGLRPAECAALKIKDIDFEKDLLHVSSAVESGTKVIAPPKSNAGVRFVPIPSGIRQELLALTEGRDCDNFVFTQNDGKSMLTETSIRRRWESFSRQMDLYMGAEHTPSGHIYDPSDLDDDGTPLYPDPKDPTQPRNGHKIAPDLVLYCLRHTYGTDLQHAGVPINIIKYLMGHSDIAVTSNIYVDSGEADALYAASIINPPAKENMPNMQNHMQKTKPNRKNL